MMIVNFPITVPSGVHCWEYGGRREICEHFDNEGGHPHCELGFYLGISCDGDKAGVRKSSQCVALHPVKEL